MELWAHVAFFLPFSEVFGAFWALRRAMVLPLTGTPPGNALLQFCSEVREEEEEEIDPEILGYFVAMGFEASRVEDAMRRYPCDVDLVIEFLMWT